MSDARKISQKGNWFSYISVRENGLPQEIQLVIEKIFNILIKVSIFLEDIENQSLRIQGRWRRDKWEWSPLPLSTSETPS